MSPRTDLRIALPTLTLALLAAPAAALAAALGPVAFEPNLGQAAPAVDYLARCRGYDMLLAGSQIELALRGPSTASPRRVSLELVGAADDARVRGVDPRPGSSHYYRSADPDGWVEQVPHYGAILIEGVYPGIDVVLYGTPERELELDLVLDPGADPAHVALRSHGAEDRRLDDDGNVVLSIGGERFLMRRPIAYQELDGRRREVAAGFTIGAEGDVAFRLGPYDRSVPLTIDPVLSYSTYFGGSAFDVGADIALDADGNIYLTGYTDSTDFPTALPAQPDRGGMGSFISDAFVAKLSADGQTLLFSTYLGGAGEDEGRSIAVDPGGPVWVTGMTESTDFPIEPEPCVAGVSCPVQDTHGGGDKDAFVARLSASGALQYSTYLGGGEDENFIAGTGAIAVDGSGSPYIVGETLSDDFPTHDALQEDFGGERDAFAVKLSPSGASFVYATFVGTSNLDVAHDAAVDADGNLYAAGRFASDPWVFELSADGDELLIDRTVSTGYSEWAEGLAIDEAGSIYLVGRTQAFELSSFPLVDPYQGTYGGGITDGFLMKLDPTGQTLLYSTFLGGSDQERLNGIALDADGNMFVVGATFSTDYPTRNSVQAASAVPGVSSDVVVSVLDPSGAQLLFSSYVGGSGGDSAAALAVDASSRIHLTGSTQSSDLPTVSPYDGNWNFGADALLMRLEPSLEPPLFADGFESGDVSAWSASVP